MDQGTGIGVFQHPQRAVGTFFHIADAVADIPALGGCGAAMAVKDDTAERLSKPGGPSGNNGEEPLDLTYLMIVPDTLLSGRSAAERHCRSYAEVPSQWN